MLSTEQINEVHRLYWSELWPIRKIERHLRVGWRTIEKYLKTPAQGSMQRTISSWAISPPISACDSTSTTVLSKRVGSNRESPCRIMCIPWIWCCESHTPERWKL